MPTVMAAEEQNSSGLSITPRKNYRIESGKSVTDRLNISNLSGKGKLTITMRMVDFTFMDDSGTPKLNLDTNANPTPWSLRQFADFPDGVVVEPSKSQNVDMTIRIPKEVGAGSYYGAIVYSATGSDGGNVNLNASGVTLVFVTVPGEVKENMSLKKFGAYNEQTADGKGGYVFIASDKEPERIGFTLKNDGNVFEAPTGNITMSYMFGGKERSLEANSNASLALIGQERTFTTCIKLAKEEVDVGGVRSSVNTCDNPGLWPGRYTIKLSLFYGQNGNQTKEISDTATFWYLPWWFLIALLVVTLMLAAIIYTVVSKVRNHLYGGKQSFRGPKKLKAKGRRR